MCSANVENKEIVCREIHLSNYSEFFKTAVKVARFRRNVLFYEILPSHIAIIHASREYLFSGAPTSYQMNTSAVC